MKEPFGDRLAGAIRKLNAAVCVGLDPVIDKFPADLRELAQRDPSEAILAYGRGVIEAVAGKVPAIKINIAFFEPFFENGLRVYCELTRVAHSAGLIVIGDIKRADIGHSSQQYATAHIGADRGDQVDAITVNPYFGSDGVEPFIETALKTNRGVIVLVQTSNASASQVQGLTFADGRTVCQKVASLVQSWAARSVGASGYSLVGAVVSPRDLPSTVLIRELMPNCIFLVPGFGAQGRTADEVAKCFKPDGSGSIVTASRSVIYAYAEPRYIDMPWQAAVAASCDNFAAEIRELTQPS